MIVSQGWISIHRKLMKNWLWVDKPFSKGQAWIDILLRVNHESGKAVVGKQVIDVEPGQTVWSVSDMAERWGWSRKKVDGFMMTLRKQEMLHIKSTTKYTLLTVENWAFYQCAEQQKNNKGTSVEHQKHNKSTQTIMSNTEDNEEQDDIPSATADKQPPCPYEKIVDLYHQTCPSFPKVKEISDSRKGVMRTLWTQGKEKPYFLELFRRAEASDFLTGRNGKHVAFGFDWIMKPANRQKIMEGNYDNER